MVRFPKRLQFTFSAKVFKAVAIATRNSPSYKKEDNQVENKSGSFWQKKWMKVFSQWKGLRQSCCLKHRRNYFQTKHSAPLQLFRPSR